MENKNIGKALAPEKKGFSRAFWVANSVELLERLAYYAVFIVITLYLSNILGFTDGQAGIISGAFSALLYLLPTFVGAYADKIGFRTSIILAFGLLTVGYAGLGVLPTMLESAGLVTYGTGDGLGVLSDFFSSFTDVVFGTNTEYTGLAESAERWIIVPILLLIVVGGAFIKAVISGTVAKETTSETRARGYAIFYMMVNFGAFTGKTVVDPLRRSLGDYGLVYLNYFSAFMTFLAFITVIFLYKSSKVEGQGKKMSEIWTALVKLVQNKRLIILILIVTGFWTVQQQLYASMPKYVIRMVGEDASPGWIANVNPFVVFLSVSFVTSLMAKKRAITSMVVGMFIIPFSALIMAGGNMIGSGEILGLHPVTFMMILGIVFQALAECFISPRFLEYFSKQSPEGEEGLYLGFSHLHSFFSSLIAFISAGYLLEAFCPDPRLYEVNGVLDKVAYADATSHAHYLWFVFCGVGIVSAVALLIYGKVYDKRDKKSGFVDVA
ncbi:dipeptide/tripeptide permease [Balneicella halophila]|uniref:Dipeptide/tripeptide permease n=1 Tax=Balneicella halophila TaxID=1537566 RepID=A0A7L4US30_BALHA|nr:MFS transporter [Balneicella halophila]PVX52586.1 dipeptide/tripeptide permease [Balneicella halophila]